MKYEVIEAKDAPGDWIVEGINHESEGEITMIRFSGYRAEEFSKRLAEVMNTTPGVILSSERPVSIAQ